MARQMRPGGLGLSDDASQCAGVPLALPPRTKLKVIPRDPPPGYTEEWYATYLEQRASQLGVSPPEWLRKRAAALALTPRRALKAMPRDPPPGCTEEWYANCLKHQESPRAPLWCHIGHVAFCHSQADARVPLATQCRQPPDPARVVRPYRGRSRFRPHSPSCMPLRRGL